MFGPCFAVHTVLSVHPCIAIISLGKREREREREREKEREREREKERETVALL